MGSQESFQHFVEHMAGDDFLRVQDDLGHGFVRLRAAEAQRRQAKQDIRTFEDVVLEVLRNARDAHARAIFVATWTEDASRCLTVLDDGDGIPSDMHETVFEPFVTSKLDTFRDDRWGVHGRGMALYSIRQNVSDAHIVASEPGLGTVMSITSPFSLLKEKRDQSTLPSISIGSDGKPVLRGPHNIVRIVMEFTIEERQHISVYLGSSASIVATLYNLGVSAASRLTTVFSSYDASTPYIQRFAYVDDAEDLAQLANELALPISNRTAHRILNGEIEALPLHVTLLNADQSKKSHGTPEHNQSLHHNGSDNSSARRSTQRVKFATEDMMQFTQAIQSSFGDLARKYYLDPTASVSYTSSKDELVIHIPLVNDCNDQP